MKNRVFKEELYKEFYGNERTERGVVENIIPFETAMVLHLHYRYEKTLKDITQIIGKSISLVYNHHNRGLYLLEKYLNKPV